MITQALASIGRYRRPFRFAAVGVVGAVVNSALLFVFINVTRWDPVVDGAVATELAIFCNFALNDAWTFRDRPYKRSWVGRAIRYNGIAAGGWAVSVTTLALMIHVAGLPPMGANIFALMASFSVNYMANKRFTFAPYDRPSSNSVVTQTVARI